MNMGDAKKCVYEIDSVRNVNVLRWGVRLIFTLLEVLYCGNGLLDVMSVCFYSVLERYITFCREFKINNCSVG